MKAKELMIGDLVIFEGNVHKVTYLSLCVDGSTLVNVNGHDVQIFEHEISPIPLSEDILKMNGIDIFKNCDLSLPLYTMGIKVVERGVYIKMHFKYVHELQHALRLCGLNDFADNFKVE